MNDEELNKIFIILLFILSLSVVVMLLFVIFSNESLKESKVNSTYEWKSVKNIGTGAVYCYDSSKEKICVLPDASTINVLEFSKVK